MLYALCQDFLMANMFQCKIDQSVMMHRRDVVKAFGYICLQSFHNLCRMARTKATHRRSQVRRRQREARRVALAPQSRALAGSSNEKNSNVDSITSLNTANASNASPAGNVHTVPSSNLTQVTLSCQSLTNEAELNMAHPSEGAEKPEHMPNPKLP